MSEEEESARDRLVGSVTSRLNQASSTGDFAVTREPAAQHEADELMGYLATADGVDLRVQYLVGMLHLMRVIADPQGEQDGLLATVLLAPLYFNPPGTPDLLPAPVRGQLEQVFGSVSRQAEAAEVTQRHAESLNNLGMLLLQRRATSDDKVAAKAAVSVLRQAIAYLAADRPSRAMVLCNLGYALIVAEPQPDELTQAVAVLREAFGGTPPGDANYARCANGLGLALLGASNIAQDRGMLAEATEKLRVATRSVPDTEPGLPQMLSDLGFALLAYAKSAPLGAPAALEEAVTVLRRGTGLLPKGDPRRPQALLRLADALLTADKRLEATELMLRNGAELGVDVAQEVRGLLREDLLRAATSVEQPMRDRDQEERALRDLPDATNPLVEVGGRPADDSANPLTAIWRLLGYDVDPADQSRHADMARLMNQMLDTDTDDMSSVLGFAAKAMESMIRRYDDLPPEERGEALADYFKALRERDTAAEETTTQAVDTSSLDELMELHERLLPELEPGSREEILVRNSGQAIRMVKVMTAPVSADPASRLRQQREMAPLIKEIMESAPEMLKDLGLAPGRIEALAAFAHALSPVEELARLSEWIREIRRRLAGLPPGTQESTEARTALAVMLFAFSRLSLDKASFAEARDIARDLAATAWPLSAALLSGWTQTQTGRLQMANLTASLPDVAGQSVHPVTRLVSDRAARSLAEHDATGALEELEGGRSVLLSGAVNVRSELEALRGADAELHSRLLAVLDEMTALRRAGALAGRLASPEEGARAQELMNEGTRLVAELKQRPGLSRFLAPVPLGLADLRPAAADGPVITVNVNPRRCDALILRQDGGLRPVPLPDLAARDLAEQADSLRAAVDILATRPGSPLTASARDIFDGVLGWLWDALAEPVLKAVGLSGPPAPGEPWPRIWWSPTGVLNSFPLHAAGHHDQPGASVLDRAASSYTPTLRSLLLARARARRIRDKRQGWHQEEPRRALAVAMPDTAGHAPLTRTVAEATAAAGRDGLRLTGTGASRTAVLAALPAASVAHFACHAGSDPEDPAASHLLLGDGPLSLHEIAALRLDGAELAYLSACGTSRGGMVLADEAIHLAAAFQLAGYAQSVGTLWEVGDTFAATAAAEFHRILAPAMDGPAFLPAALALHATVRELRDSPTGQPWAWSALVHAGA